MQGTKRKSFFAAVVCLILCVSLLIGTTFAWFTDSVSNTGNRIQAGSLSIDLLMDKMQTGDADSYVSVKDGTGDIFTENGTGYKDGRANGIKWEPGKTEIVFLAVENNGNLALKYNIIIDAIDEGLLDTATGTSSLEYALLDGAKASDIPEGADWETVKAAAGSQTGDVTAGRTTAAQNGVLDEIVNGTENERDYFALAVHMKESAGNEYQGLDALIDINIVAAQKDAETDGFNNPDYDANATLPSIAEPVNGWGTATSTRTKSTQASSVTIQIVNESEDVGEAEVPANAVNGILTDMLGDIQSAEGTNVEDKLVLTLSIETKSTTAESVTLDVSMNALATRTVDGNVTDTKQEEVTDLDDEIVTFVVNLEAGLENVQVTHSHGTGTIEEFTKKESLPVGDKEFNYNESTGLLTIATSKFSDFIVSYTRNNAVENETLNRQYVSIAEALKDSELADGHSLKLNAASNAEAAVSKDIVINLNGNNISNLTVNSEISFTGDGNISAETGDSGIINISDGTHNSIAFTGTGNVLITGGTYGVDPSVYVAPGYQANPSGEVWTVEKAATKYVAQIGSVFYETFEEAAAVINAAPSGSDLTVYIINDCNMSKVLFTCNLTLEVLENVTFTANNIYNFVFTINDYSASMTLCGDGSIVLNDSDLIYALNTGNTVNIRDITINGSDSDVVFISAGCACNAYDVKVNGCTLYAGNYNTDWYGMTAFVHSGYYSCDISDCMPSNKEVETLSPDDPMYEEGYRYTTKDLPEAKGEAYIVRDGVEYYYSDVLDAVKMAEANETVVLMKDTTKTASYAYAYYTSMTENTVPVTLDLNGKTFTAKKYGLGIYGTDTLTIKNGTIAGDSVNALCIKPTTKLILDNVTVKAEASGKYVFECLSTYLKPTGKIEIKSGNYTGSGGVFNSYATKTGYEYQFELSGGTYSENPPAGFIASGKTAVQNQDGTWTVQ